MATAGKEEHLIDQLINSVNLRVAYLFVPGAGWALDTQRLNDALQAQGGDRSQQGRGWHCGLCVGTVHAWGDGDRMDQTQPGRGGHQKRSLEGVTAV